MSILYGGSILPIKTTWITFLYLTLWAQDHTLAIAYRLPLMPICSAIMDMGPGTGPKKGAAPLV